MDNIPGFLRDVLATSAVVTALLGVLGYLARSQLSHWLNRDLEATKAQFQRELEAYKVSLIAEAERVKLAAELQKAAALKMVEKKFAAVDRYHKASAGLAAHFAVLATAATEHRSMERWNAATAKLEALKSAELELALFLPVAQRTQLLDYRNALLSAHNLGIPGKAPPTGQQSAELRNQVIAAELTADGIVERLTGDMLGVNEA